MSSISLKYKKTDIYIPLTKNPCRDELLWFYQGGAANLFPDVWETFVQPIPEVERGDLISAYHRRLTGNDKEVKD